MQIGKKSQSFAAGAVKSIVVDGLGGNDKIRVNESKAALAIRLTIRGGDGIVREVELLTDAQVTILSDRRKTRPYGLNGGESGAPGRTLLITREGERVMAGKDSSHANAGDRIRIETPGGGGCGVPSERPDAARLRDIRDGYVSK